MDASSAVFETGPPSPGIDGLVDDEFARYLNASTAPFVIEPAWKMLLSNKAFLATAWELFPGNPYLLRTEFHQLPGSVRKPFIGREGANITLPGRAETAGPYTGPYVWQERFTAEFDNHFPVIGSWLIGSESAGIGIRESLGNPVTTNTSRFVPHVWK